MIQIRYFGVLQQQLGVRDEQWPWAGGDGHALLAQLQQRGEHWAAALAEDKIFRLVVDQTIVAWDAQIADGAAVALLPPVTGG